MSTMFDTVAVPATLWQRLADDEGYSDLIVVVALVVLAGFVAASIVGLKDKANAWTGVLAEQLDRALKTASGG